MVPAETPMHTVVAPTIYGINSLLDNHKITSLLKYRQCRKVDSMTKPTLFMCKYDNKNQYFCTYSFSRDCFALCFMHLVQKDLDRIKVEWNCHRIRQCRQSCCPSGHPNELYELPQLLGMIRCRDSWSIAAGVIQPSTIQVLRITHQLIQGISGS